MFIRQNKSEIFGNRAQSTIIKWIYFFYSQIKIQMLTFIVFIQLLW